MRSPQVPQIASPCSSAVPSRAGPRHRSGLQATALLFTRWRFDWYSSQANVAGMHVAQQNPFLAWHQTRADFAIRQMALFGATEDEGAGIARIVDDLPRTTVQQLGPDQLAFVRRRYVIGVETGAPSHGTP